MDKALVHMRDTGPSTLADIARAQGLSLAEATYAVECCKREGMAEAVGFAPCEGTRPRLWARVADRGVWPEPEFPLSGGRSYGTPRGYNAREQAIMAALLEHGPLTANAIASRGVGAGGTSTTLDRLHGLFIKGHVVKAGKDTSSRRPRQLWAAAPRQEGEE